ncbi:histidine kinase [Actinoallomurus oryzae]|uniref:histidine kinase n=2 Tax=Actinoallomurus oryzae TaxID=502180 RepID=A0ABP8Q4Z5_9ACTN
MMERLRRIDRLIDPAIPWVLGAVVGLLSVVYAEGFIGMLYPPATGPAAPWLHPLIIVFCVACGVAAGLARRRRWPVFALAALGWVWLALWPASMVAAYYAGTSLRRTRVVTFGLAALAVAGVSIGTGAAVGGSRYLATATFPNIAILLAVLVGLPLATGLWVNARRLAFAALRERARRLEREQVARDEQARAQERTRVAREMHDVVAHRVSLMVLHAGALEVGAGDERTAEAAALIRGIGREALSDLRNVLGVLRSPYAGDATVPQPTLSDLDRLLDQTRSLGIRVTRRDEGEVRALPDLVERTAYRVVQEALTNVHKHAGGAPTEVALRYLPDEIEVAVCNDPGDGPDDPLPGAGLGLSGLRERVGLLGGAFEACPRPDGGFEMIARLPAEGGTG